MSHLSLGCLGFLLAALGLLSLLRCLAGLLFLTITLGSLLLTLSITALLSLSIAALLSFSLLIVALCVSAIPIFFMFLSYLSLGSLGFLVGIALSLLSLSITALLSLGGTLSTLTFSFSLLKASLPVSISHFPSRMNIFALFYYYLSTGSLHRSLFFRSLEEEGEGRGRDDEEGKEDEEPHV